jgi:hypothetical protein
MRVRARAGAIDAPHYLAVAIWPRKLILFLILIGIYFFIGRVILFPKDWPTTKGWEVVSIDPIQADTQLVVENFTSSAATHPEWAQRSSVLHPLLKLFIAPMGSLAAGRIGAFNTALLLCAIFASLSVILLRLQLNEVNPFYANFFSAVYACSTTILLYAGLPETFIISSVSIQLLIFCARKHTLLFLLLSIVAIGTLIANIIPVLSIYAYRRTLFGKRLLSIELPAFILIIGCFVILGMQIQSMIYPYAASPFENGINILTKQKDYLFSPASSEAISNKIRELTSDAFLTNIVSASPVVSQSQQGAMLKWGGPFTSTWDAVMKFGWILLVILGIADWKGNTLQLLLFSLIGFYLVLFFIYGDDLYASFLYSPCWTAPLIGAIALNPGYQTIHHKSALLCIGFLILQLLTNLANLILFAGMMATENW